MFLKQSTAYTFRHGPFLDETDGKTAETGLTISQADVRLSKAGGDFAQKNESTSASHDELGFYIVILDATDTDTCGELLVAVHESGALPVFKTFQVLEEHIYDALFAASAAAFDANQRVDVSKIEGSDATDQVNTACDAAIVTYGLDHLVSTSVTGTDVTDNSIIAKMVSKESTADWDDFVNTDDSLQAIADGGGGGGGPSASTIADAVWDEATSGHTTSGTFGKLAADVLEDTNELQSDDIPGTLTTITGKIDTIDGIVDNILVDTAVIGAAGAGLTAIPWNSAWDAEVQSECADALTAYDAPTNTEMVAAFTEIKGSGWSASTDTLEKIYDASGGSSTWTTTLTESYASDGAAATPAQLLYMIYCAVGEFSISGTTITGKKLDGSTTAMTWTLDSATAPTSRTRAS
tara:strand:- start:55 stop:1278 length:1224 start_codon:yes stop_codon:yes gene_type:complete